MGHIAWLSDAYSGNGVDGGAKWFRPAGNTLKLDKMGIDTLKELYDNSIKSFGSRPAFSMLERESMTYNDFDDRVEYVRGMLLSAGLNSGDKVALLSGNMPNWNVCYFAVVTLGMVIVPILPDFSGEELEMILTHSESKALMVTDKLYARVPKHVLDSMNIVVRTKNLGVISRTVSELGTPSVPRPDDLAVIIYTSGTTSRPKGVMLTHKALVRQIEMDFELFPVYPDDIFLSILPLSHTYECSLGMIYPFSKGSSVVYVDRPPTASNLLPALKLVRPTIMLSVPLVIDKLYKSAIVTPFGKTKLKRWLYRKGFSRKFIHRIAGKKLYKAFGGRLRFFGVGGAKLDMEAERFLFEGRFPYAIGYGLTETAPLLAGAIPGKTRLGSTGPILNGVEYRLDNINEDGEGELVVKTPCIMKGYFKNEELTREVLTEDGWFHTKDLCAVDGEGYLFVKGRLNSMIVGPSGENIYPEDIESVLNSHFLVADSIVTQDDGKLVALVHFNKNEMEQRYYEWKDNLSAKMEEIKKEVMNYVNSKVSKGSKIATVEEQEEEFEKTPSLKIKRYLYSGKKDNGKETGQQPKGKTGKA